MLRDFIRSNREELIARARAKVASRSAPRATEDELAFGVPKFLSQLEDILELEASDSQTDGAAIALTATQHGGDLLHEGLSVGQVVHDYGDVCQAVTDLAVERKIAIDAAEFRTLNLCLDNAIASAVTEYAAQREATVSRGEVERLGVFAHELRNLLNAATLAFHALERGDVGVHGSTGAVLRRSLTSLSALVDRSLSEVRLASGRLYQERTPLPAFFEDIGIVAALDAKKRGIDLTLDCSRCDVAIDVDRHLLGSAISNLLQNAFKFTRPNGNVQLRAGARGDRVTIEVEDECGGLPPGNAELLFRAFEQRGTDRTGVGLGLVIAQRAVQANGGVISVRDLPGKGCVFAIELPVSIDSARAPKPAASREST